MPIMGIFQFIINVPDWINGDPLWVSRQVKVDIEKLNNDIKLQLQ